MMNIQINNVDVVLGKKNILNKMNCHIGPHIYALMGSNGSGKTTFIRTILGLYKIKSGEIIVNDGVKDKNIEQFRIGYLPQLFDTFKDLTVYDQLKYFAILKEVAHYEQEIEKVLKISHLTNQKEMKCKKLSGGMVRRLGIAQALLGKPDILILDEPTAGLDIHERVRFKDMISNLDLDIPIIISTHIIEDIKSLCTHLIVLKKGSICYEGSTDDLLDLFKERVYSCSHADRKLIPDDAVIVSEKDEKMRFVTTQEINKNFANREIVMLEDAYLYLSDEVYDG